ncbi:MAG: radical SAM protein [Pseudomonadota bacterium]|nr:radical SAM protein [Pseudomonadota bacterium]
MSWAIRGKFRELLNREEGYERRPWGNALAICLAYPNRYRTGMGNLGFQTVYRLLNREPAVICERVFLPDPGDEACFSPGSLPLFSLESQRPLRDFDIVAFSLSFENDYPHILQILALGGVPLLAGERTAGDPLVIAGGICVTMNPEPLADFFDLFLIGEAEALLPAFLVALRRCREKGDKKDDLLLALQREVPGVYVPRLYEVVYGIEGAIAAMNPVIPSLPRTIGRKWVPDIRELATESAIMTPAAEFGAMRLMEISRGCGRGCRFCAAGYIYRPARFRSRESIQGAIAPGLAKGRKIGLIGTAVSDHPQLLEICRDILAAGGQIGAASLRLDMLSPELVALLGQGGIKTPAVAPEAGSQRLRDMIRKGISEADIITAATNLLEGGFERLRLYFLVGLPTETDNDIEAIVELLRRLSRLTTTAAKGGEKRFRRLTASVNQFIPKAGTPFQWHPLEDIQTTRKKIQAIANAFRGRGDVKIAAEPPKSNYLQALFARGDRRVGRLLLALHNREGNWAHARKESALDPDFFVYRLRGAREILPWDFIATGVPKTLLRKEFEAARLAAANKID